jgi:homoserine kinase type II
MAVYTHLSERAIRQHLRPFQLGDLIEARGIESGTINTIYQVSTTRGRYILRILENRSPKDAEFEEALLLHLHGKGLTVPRMVGAGRRGRVIPIAPRQHLSVFQYLPGREVGVFEVRPDHCAQAGEFLATMHVAARGLKRRKKNRFEPERVAKILERCAYGVRDVAHLRDLKLMALELVRHHFPDELPRGTIHGDLFIDNVRFSRGKLVGVLDFEMASTGPLAYDLAVAICDWAFLHDRFVPDRARALVQGYQRKRKLTPTERGQLFDLCRFAATRFAATRFYDFEVRRRPGARRLYKDYRHFVARLSSLKALGPQLFRDQVLGRNADAQANG